MVSHSSTLVPSLGLRIGPACEAGLSAAMRRERVPPQKRKKERNNRTEIKKSIPHIPSFYFCCNFLLHAAVWIVYYQSSSSRMRVMNHNWSAMKQRLHPQSVAEISRHSVLSGTGFDNVGHRLGLATRTQISVCKSPFPSAGTAVSLFRAKTVQQRPLLPREVETRLLDCGVIH